MTTQVSSQVEQEIAIEQAHVDKVYSHLAHAHKTAEKVAQDANQRFQIDRADWLREENQTALFERDAFTFQAARRLAILDSEHEGLVFGRLDHTDHEISYIGRIGVRDEDYEPLVIDWRAPASEPFYRATSTDPMGVARRRVLRCRGEKVIGIEDDLLDAQNSDQLVVVGEGALMAALKRARTTQMRDIVATIQAEQDEAIRAPYQGFTIISGGPGTGKTVVALHRAAYLLYSHRRRFENGGVLVIGPSSIFMNYIERVLPSLGENSVTLRPVGAVSSDIINHHAQRVDDTEIAYIKGSLSMVKLLRRLIAQPFTPSDYQLQIVVKGEVLTLPHHKLQKIRKEVLATNRYNRAVKAMTANVLDHLWAQFAGDFTDEDFTRQLFNTTVTESATWKTFVQTWWPQLTPVQVLLRAQDEQLLQTLAGKEFNAHQMSLLAGSYAQLNPDHPDWSIADMALLDELYAQLSAVQSTPEEDDEFNPTDFLLAGSEVQELVSLSTVAEREIDPDDEGFRTFAHILVDEAQDITPMQWRMLRRRGPQASWTIVGDLAQSSWVDPEESQQALQELMGKAPQRNYHMSTNYRSPAEVFNLAGKIVKKAFPQADLPKAVRSVGKDPELEVTTWDTLPQTLAHILQTQLQLVEGTVGIIVPQSRLLQTEQILQQIVATHPKLESELGRIILVSALLAKGLEYDTAIVLSPDEIVSQTAGGVRVLYVALTRATLNLVTIDCDGEPGSWRAAL